MQDFKKLRVWEESHSLVLRIYRVTRKFPREEVYGLTSQMRRAVASIPTNIAEGCGMSSGSDFARFLQYALGSICELEYHLILAKDLEYLDAASFGQLADEAVSLRKMIASLLTRVRARGPAQASRRDRPATGNREPGTP